MENVGHILTFLGSSWIAADFFLKIRNKIDEIRNVSVFQIDPNIQISKEVRMYMLTKDIKERVFTLVFVLFLYGIAMVTFAYLSLPATSNWFREPMHLLFLVGGILGIIGSILTALISTKDYKQWKERLEKGA